MQYDQQHWTSCVLTVILVFRKVNSAAHNGMIWIQANESHVNIKWAKQIFTASSYHRIKCVAMDVRGTNNTLGKINSSAVLKTTRVQVSNINCD